jgi:hypothetical protein
MLHKAGFRAIEWSSYTFRKRLILSTTPFQDDFSYTYFRRLVAAMQLQYLPCRFSEAPARLREANGPILFLRHDIDVSIERALDMARIEQEIGMRATYMVLTNAALYDFRLASSIRLIRELHRYGHEVGLHFDIQAEGVPPDATAEDLDRALARARDALADALGARVSSCSFHRPIPRLLRGPLVIADMVNAYAAELMAGYISDSKASWREGEPLPKLLAQPIDVLQVLIHPIWWAEQHQSGPDRLGGFFEEQTSGKPPDAVAAYSAAVAQAVPAVPRAGWCVNG